MKNKCLLSIISVVLVLMCGFTEANAAEMTYNLGYCSDNIQSGVGLASRSEVSQAIYLPASKMQLFQGSKIKKIKIGLFANSTNVSVFITSKLGETNIASKSVGTLSSGWTEVELDEPYEITGDLIYVGYTATGTYQCGVSDAYKRHASWYAIQGTWADYSSQGFGAACIQAVIVGENMPAAMSLASLDNTIGDINKPITIIGSVKSETGMPITSYEISYKIGDGETMTKTFTDVVNPLEEKAFSIDVPAMAEPVSTTVTASVTKVNGVANDQVDGIEADARFICREYTFAKKVVVEEGTGTWCGWCPRGIVGLRNMKAKYPDTFIGIAVHAGDKMAVSSYNAFLNKYISGYPNCIVDRRLEWAMDPNYDYLEIAYERLMAEGADAEIKATATYTDSDMTKITIDTKTTFGMSNDDAAYRIAYVVLENDVAGYEQTNNYAGGGYGVMGGFESLPSTASINYDDVARGIFGSYAGTLNSVPASITKGETYDYSYTLTVPSVVAVKSNIEVAVLLINTATGEIMNADKVSVVPSGVFGVGSDSLLRIYAADGEVKVAGDYDAIEVYKVSGERVGNFGLGHGVYVAKVTAAGKVTVTKVVM